MKIIKHFLTVSVVLVLAACSVSKPDQQSSQELKQWKSEEFYAAGSYVQYFGQIYRATTATKKISPVDSESTSGNPMGAWARSSAGEYQTQKRILSIRSGGYLGSISSANLEEIPLWKSGTVYHGNDLVKQNGNFYQSMWWNQDNNPNLPEFKNNFTDSEGVTHWGPWVSLTAEEALKILENQQGIVNPDGGSGSGDGGSGSGDGDSGSEDGGSGSGDIVIDPPTGEVSQENIKKFTWSSTVVYLENDLAVVDGNRFFRSKWWNQDHSPVKPFEQAWDSPWEEISEKRFADILENGNPTSPDDKPKPPVIDPNPPVVDPNPPVVDPEYEEIQKRGYIQEWSWDQLSPELKEAFNGAALGGGGNIFASDGNQAVQMFSSKINSRQWDLLFPRRRGAKGWEQENPGQNVDDYYSYDNFVDALKVIGDYAYLIQVALDPNTSQETSFERNYVLHKPSKTVRLISQSSDYFAANNDWLLNRPHKLKVVDYAAFGAEGTANDKARGISGFLAHASHETSGSWATAPGYNFDKNAFPGANFPDYIGNELPGELAWSLYFNEEVAYSGATSSHYQDDNNKIFPPVAGQSYHGRGAFQLSWNYNYGLASAIFFGTSRVLLENANFILTGGVVPSGWIQGRQINGGTMAFLTSLMFWLTPQGPKPSQQDTMILNRQDGRYVRGTSKLNEHSGLGTPGYGWTINIMNGGFEAGKSWQESHPKFDAKVARRVKHYLFFTQGLGGNNDGEVLDTVNLHPY